MVSRREFPAKVKLAAWRRSAGHCENPDCGQKLFPGNVEYDHREEDYLGGKPTLENCIVLCRGCHGAKTKERRPLLDKTRALEKKNAGIRRAPKRKIRSRGFPCKWCGRAPCRCEEVTDGIGN